jgi:hypothetical protein
MVIADHSDFFRSINPGFFRPLTFHVVGFFFLNFYGTYFSKDDFQSFSTKRLVRYLWPFFIFYSGYAFISLFFLKNTHVDINSYILGGLIGSFDKVKQGCGGAFMWFLPTLLGFTLLVRITSFLHIKFAVALMLFAFVFHLYTGNLPSYFSVWQPLGIGVAVYLIPLLAVFIFTQTSNFFRYFFESWWGIFVNLIVAVLCHFSLVRSGINIETGALDVPTYHSWYYILINFISNISALIFLWAISKRIHSSRNAIASIGKYSLAIYLIHPLFSGLFANIFLRFGIEITFFVNILFAVASYIFTVASSWLFSYILHTLPRFNSMIFPRDINELRRVFGLNFAHSK